MAQFSRKRKITPYRGIAYFAFNQYSGKNMFDHMPIVRPKKGTLKMFLWWICLIITVVTAGIFAQSINLPGGWLIGALIVTIIFGITKTDHPHIKSKWFVVCQSVVGMLLAGSFRPEVIPVLVDNWLSIVLIIIITIGISMASGVFLSRISTLTRETATLGTLPGGASSMIAMSVGSKADTRMVALMQYLRLTFVVLSASFLARFVFHASFPAQKNLTDMLIGKDSPVLWKVYLLTAALAAMGSFCGRFFRLPAGALLGSLIAGIIVKEFTHFNPAWPSVLLHITYLFMGMYIGLLFDRKVLQQVGKLLPLIMANIIFLILVCALSGKVLSLLTGSDYMTGYLATTPGGMDSVAVVALGSGAEMPIVMTVQMVRLLTLIFFAPFLSRFVLGGKK
jgi:uncharacterized protein